MKEKKQLRIFTIAEGEKEEQYLQKRHRERWKFTKVSLPGLYHFEKCTPENVTYQLDYDEEGLKHKDEYVQMFKDCGREYIQDFGGTVISASQFLKCRGKRKSSVTMSPGWI